MDEEVDVFRIVGCVFRLCWCRSVDGGRGVQDVYQEITMFKADHSFLVSSLYLVLLSLFFPPVFWFFVFGHVSSQNHSRGAKKMNKARGHLARKYGSL